MDEPVMAELMISKETAVVSANGNAGESEPVLSLRDKVHNAAEFGWLVAELLARCFLLQEAKPPDLHFDGKELVVLEGLLTPREKLRAIGEHMSYLAETLSIGKACIIDHTPDDYEGKPYIDAIRGTIKQLCKGDFDASKGETFETVRGKINERVFFWDLKINDALQDGPAVIEKAYLVGYCLGGLRWWYGLPDIQLDKSFKAKVLQSLPVIGPHLPQFAQAGLAISVAAWWDAISTQQSTTMPASLSDSQQEDGLAPDALQRQGHIWHSLITGECDALSYVDPTIRNRPYIWQVFQVAWPFFVLSGIFVLLIFAFAIYVIISYHNQVVTEFATLGTLLTTFGIVQLLQKNAGEILQKAVAEANATIKGSYLDRIWNATLQKDVNKAIFIPPPVTDKGKNAPQSPAQK